MDLNDSPDEAAFRELVRTWLAENAPPFESADAGIAYRTAADAASAEEYRAAELRALQAAQRWQGHLAVNGWAGIAWPTLFGGRGGSPMQEAIFAEEAGRYAVSTGPLLVSLAMVAPTLMRHATPDQQRTHLDPLLRGERVWCQLFSEPGAGSDLAALRTRAERTDTGWRISGQKVWTSSAQVSDWAILLARTNVALPKHEGITYFLVDMASPGIEVRPLRLMNGSYHFNEVFLDGVEVPEDAVIGAVDDGWAVARTTLANERVMIGGASGQRFRRLVEVARTTGRISDPVWRQHLARTYAQEEVLRLLGMRMRTALSRGVPPGPEGSVLKLLFARLSEQAAQTGLLAEGPAGLLFGQDAPASGSWQQEALSAPGMRIGGGTDEVQRNAIAERVLGLPRETAPDRGVPFRDLQRS